MLIHSLFLEPDLLSSYSTKFPKWRIMSSTISQMGDIANRLQKLIDLKCDGKSTIFAKKAGIPISSFSNYMRGRIPSAETLFLIRETYSVNINWLLTGKGKIFEGDSIASDDKHEDTDLDMEILHRILKWVEEWLDSKNKTLSPDKKARFVALAYKYFTTPRDNGKGRDMNDKDMNDWLRLVV